MDTYMFFFYFENFEREMISLLQDKLGQDKVKIEEDIPKTGIRADAIISDASSFLDTQKSIIVEIVAQLTSVKINHIISQALRNPQYAYLIIYNSDTESQSKYNNTYLAPRKPLETNGTRIYILSDNEIKEKLNGQTSRNNHRRSIPLKSTILTKAAKDFQSQNTTIFLGAGVSIDAGLPSWKKFLKNIMNALKCSNGHNILTGNDYEDILHQCHDSSIIAGQYLKEYSTQSIRDIAKESLYKDFRPTNHLVLDAIVEIINAHTPKSVITYNYDDLLENNLEAINEIVPLAISGGQIIPEGILPIYHVHGYIPQGQKLTEDIILTEESYHKIYQEPYHWSNIVQLNALNHTTCFLIGFSMADPNLRRLLDISMKNCIQADDNNNPEPRHYVFLQKEKLKPNCPECKKNMTNEEVQKRIFNRLGLNVIWFDKFEDLPKKIMRLRKNQ